MIVRLLPLLVFAALVGFLARGLSLDPREVPSPLIDKASPEFSIATMLGDGSQFNSADMLGQVWVLNVFASWCAACVTEHPNLLELSKKQMVPLVGLNYKDREKDAARWLDRFGNPYSTVLADGKGAVGLDWGVYGVPETFVMDREGKIRHKFIGPVSDSDMTDILLPLLEKLIKAPS